ncbi:EcsC family protein [Paenibacillus oenotherae]|uniref:EcsC family protein n=1 Tax=Paenibacillus oenotherae TaxID=1435645 RepID=A0ABS7CZW3_9BACL|nr:EcsC family protein [Paenibacillus oenotherae]MBW7473179.1 EcsC family protein [Paenibacillus oenotherae]
MANNRNDHNPDLFDRDIERTTAQDEQAPNDTNDVVLWTPPETKGELQAAWQVIDKWEREQKDLWFWEKLGRLPFLLLDKLTPRILQQKIGQAVDEIGSYMQTGGQYLISEGAVLRKLGAESLDEASRLPIAVMNKAADDYGQSNANLATMQGATTGIGGIFTLAIDIPAVLGLSLKVIQEVAISYGYNPKLKEERVFVIKCLQFASSDIVGKKAILEQLALFGKPDTHGQMASQLQGWREVVATYRDNFGWKKLFQLIPVAGMLFGAFINRGTLKDVAEAATMLYRKRRIMERLAIWEQQA